MTDTSLAPRRRLICHLIDSNRDTAYFRSIARCHSRDEFPVAIGSIAPPGTLQERMCELGTETFSLEAASRARYVSAVPRLVQFIRTRNVSVVHAHCFDPTCVGLAAARAARVPFVFTRHHSDHHVRIGKHWHTRVDGWCARHADRVIAVSEATRRVMREVEGVPEGKIVVVYNGMEPLPPPDPSRMNALRHELGLEGRHVCLTLARLHEEKGHRFLFEAIPSIIDRCGPAVFLLAGSGIHREILEREVAERGLSGVVRFLGQRDDVSELISLASLLVLPSLAESFGFVLVEAMSLGCPVVATEIGGIPEVVETGETGLLVPAADPVALAEAVSAVLGTPELAHRFSRMGRERAARFTFESMIQGYQAVYRQVCRV